MHGSNFETKCDQKTVSCQYKFRTFGGKMFKWLPLYPDPTWGASSYS